MHYKKIKQIAKGWSSYIWLAEIVDGKEKGKVVALKEVREKSPRKNLYEREGKMLALANSVGVGPKLIEVNAKENFVTYKFVKGKRLLDWVLDEEFETNVSKEQLYFFIKELYKQCLTLDLIGLSHNQLQGGKNILVTKRRTNGNEKFFPVIIDFEKASLKEINNTRNLGQIESFLLYNPNGMVAKKVREKMILNLL